METFIKSGHLKSRDDPLHLVRILLYHYFLKRILIKVISALVLLLHLFVTVAFGIEVVLTFDSNFLIKYVSTTLYLTLGQIGIFAYLLLEKQLMGLMYDIVGLLWPLSDDLYDKNTRKWFYYYGTMFSLIFLFSFHLGFLYCPLFGQNSDIYYATILFKKLNLTSLLPIYYLTLPYVILMMNTGSLYFNGIMMYLWIMLRNINKLIQNIPSEYDEKHYNDYQFIVNFCIKVCLKEFIIFKETFNRFKLLLNVVIVTYLYITIIAYISVAFYLIAGLDDMSRSQQIYTGFVIFCITGFTFYEGQKTLDEALSVHDNLENVNWLEWNTSNRRILIIFMLNSSQPVFAGVEGVMELRLPFSLKLLRSLGTILTFLQEVLNR